MIPGYFIYKPQNFMLRNYFRIFAKLNIEL